MTAWLLWFEGNKKEKISPFKTLESRDFSKDKERKTFSDWNVVMKHLISKLPEDQDFSNASTAQLSQLFHQASKGIEQLNQETTGRGRKRRIDRLHVTYVRKVLKKQRVATVEDGNE